MISNSYLRATHTIVGPSGKRPRTILLLVALVSAVSACQSTRAAPGSFLLSVELFASSEPLPYSVNNSLAVVSEQRACIIASYEFRVHCGSADWSEVTVFGREGEGPGEFRFPSWVLRGLGGAVGVYDGRLARLAVYTEDGTLSYTASLPIFFTPLGFFDNTILGTHTPMRPLGTPRSGTILAEVSLPGGDVLRETVLRHPHDLGLPSQAERGLYQGARGPMGELVFGTGQSEIVRYDGEGILLENFSAPSYSSELPNARDVDWYVTQMTAAFGRPSERAIRQFREEPKRYAMVSRARIFDDEGRLWVATQRDRDEHSYFDLYRGAEILGSVQVRDRLMGFDLMGSTLAVLVERSGTGPEGVPIRAIDWYRVSESRH